MKIASLRQAALIAATACAALASLPASAQFAKPEDAVGYRKMAFKMIATHFSRVNAMAQGKVAFDHWQYSGTKHFYCDRSTVPFRILFCSTQNT